ncbi:Fanconi anemia core complex-associated protein 20 [Ursus maritimus]|uniref:Fanconi anemia core complex-associated protein 20 n=1 Tax=Ursus maritimus TaxID=29073 RepID=A0A8M1H0C9_URSMA|nr:Fanconi anemia core complex-associated protein 20 [Ursus maritimus]XP_048078023.1 Fanconi anemia core complex-associated protein 20 isoform X1 [Ursus arctos]
MEAARRPRPGLRRRRPSSGGGARGGPLPGDGGECARPWAELLRAGSADLSPDGELPPLPAFRGPEPGRVPERPASPEVFTVGARTFSWTPFPPAPRGGGGPGRSYRVLLGARGRSGSPSRSPQRRPGPEPLATPGVREQLREAAPTLRSCPMCAADFAPRYESAERSGVWSGVHLRSHPSEPRGQAAVSRRGLPQERGASSAPPGHGEPGGDCWLQGLPGCGSPSSFLWKASHRNSLGLAPLDIDSHLAQCLAGSTEDVVW